MSDNTEAPTLGQIAYKGFDDYWHEGSRGIDAEAWEAAAEAVRAALAQQAATPTGERKRECLLCSGTQTHRGAECWACKQGNGVPV